MQDLIVNECQFDGKLNKIVFKRLFIKMAEKVPIMLGGTDYTQIFIAVFVIVITLGECPPYGNL